VPTIIERHPYLAMGVVAVVAVAGTSAVFVVRDNNNTSSSSTTTTSTVAETTTSAPSSTTTTVATSVGPTSSVAVTSGFYIVQKGDTLFKIASKLGVTIQALEAANGITNPDKIDAGRKLKIPVGGKLPTTTTTHHP
jgi:LysM repeat protein